MDISDLKRCFFCGTTTLIWWTRPPTRIEMPLTSLICARLVLLCFNKFLLHGSVMLSILRHCCFCVFVCFFLFTDEKLQVKEAHVISFYSLPSPQKHNYGWKIAAQWCACATHGCKFLKMLFFKLFELIVLETLMFIWEEKKIYS